MTASPAEIAYAAASNARSDFEAQRSTVTRLSARIDVLEALIVKMDERLRDMAARIGEVK